jgi:sulfur carrier protein ThiS
MAKVEIPIEVARKFTKGVTSHEVDASDLQDIIISLDKDFPGIKEALNTGLAVAIDSSILQDWFLEEVEQSSKVRFIPAIEGG